MTTRARRLLKILAAQPLCRADQTGLSQGELQETVAELYNLVDEAQHELHVIKTWSENDRITLLELTATGRGLAQAL